MTRASAAPHFEPSYAHADGWLVRGTIELCLCQYFPFGLSVCCMTAAAHIDAMFRALADPTRRRVVERLCAGPASMTELAEPFSIALPSIAKHLRVLEDGGLVRSTKRGRVRTFRIVPGSLESAEGWLATQRRLWERRLDQLDDYLKTLKEEEP